MKKIPDIDKKMIPRGKAVTLQMLLEPRSKMPQPLQAQFGMTAARESVALPLEAHEQHLATHIFQSGEELF